MNKKECQVMRDLMPLSIDGAASEASKEMVVKHVWECEECAKVYAEMQGHLLASKEEPDYLDAAARQLRRRRKMKSRLLISLTALLTAIVVVAGFFGYQYAAHGSDIPLQLDEYEAVLSRTQDGRILMNIYAEDMYLCYGISSGMQMIEDGSYVVTVTPNTTLIRSYNEQAYKVVRFDPYAYWQDGLVWVKRSAHWDEYEPLQISCIRVVSGSEERILYQTGDDIPFCSPEMDAYYQAQSEFEAIYAEADARGDALNEKMAELAKLVPEWN